MDRNELFLPDDDVAIRERERLASQKATSLRRAVGVWLPEEIKKLKQYLGDKNDDKVAYEPHRHPSYLLLCGHISTQEVVGVIGCRNFSVTHTIGISRELPFDPHFPVC